MRSLLPLILTLTTAAACLAQDAKFSFRDGAGFRELLLGDSAIVLRHMNAWDPARREETNKPYTHAYDFAGATPITKGPGGKFTHHRGMFIGWNKATLDGKTYDFWHCKNVERRHREYLTAQEETGTARARMVSVTEWPTPEGVVVIRETQRITVTPLAEGRRQLDFHFTLEAPTGPVKLDGDPQHAGFHFRAAQEVEDRTDAKYLRPAGAVAQANDVWGECPWVVCSFSVAGKPYAIAHLNHPANPQPTVYSTRNYGRFGAFCVTNVENGKPLELRYRVLIQDGAKFGELTAPDYATLHEQFVKDVK